MEGSRSTTLDGSCHCGDVRWHFESEMQGGATACNCSLCRRYGVLWIYGHEGHQITVEGSTRSYGWNRQAIDFNFCGACGCVVSWRSSHVGKDGRRRIAVNVRLCEPTTVAHLQIDHFDGLDTFEDLPHDGKTVADYWF